MCFDLFGISSIYADLSGSKGRLRTSANPWIALKSNVILLFINCFSSQKLRGYLCQGFVPDVVNFFSLVIRFPQASPQAVPR